MGHRIDIMECTLYLLFRLTLVTILFLSPDVGTESFVSSFIGQSPVTIDSCSIIDYKIEAGCSQLFKKVPQEDTEKTDEERFMPWMVTLEDIRYEAPRPICGGVIINKEWVLTTAFCLAAYRPHNIMVIAGESDFTSIEGCEQLLRVKEIIVHRKYDPFSHANDIALLKVSSQFNFTSRVSPISLKWETSSRNHMNGTCNVCGWGLMRKMSLVLKEVVLQIISNHRCKQMYPSLLSRSMFCAISEDNEKACLGDWGSPLVCGSDLVGLTSWTNGCAKQGLPVVFISVRRYIGWIRRHIERDSNGEHDTDI